MQMSIPVRESSSALPRSQKPKLRSFSFPSKVPKSTEEPQPKTSSDTTFPPITQHQVAQCWVNKLLSEESLLEKICEEASPTLYRSILMAAEDQLDGTLSDTEVVDDLVAKARKAQAEY